MDNWQVKEDEFQLEQAKLRAQIRAKECRAKPIDILSLKLNYKVPNVVDDIEELGLYIDLEDPYEIFKHLDFSEMQELAKDIQLFLDLEKVEIDHQYWEALKLVCDEELLLHQESERTGVTKPVTNEIDQMFSKKNLEELIDIEAQIQRKLTAGESNIDLDYWETALKVLVVWKSKAKLHGIFAKSLQERLLRLKTLQKQELDRKRKFKSSAEAADAIKKAKTPQLTADPYDQCMEPIIIKELPLSPENLTVLSQAESEHDIITSRKRLKALYSEETNELDSEKNIEDLSLSAIELAYVKNLSRNLGEDEFFSDIAELPQKVNIF